MPNTSHKCLSLNHIIIYHHPHVYYFFFFFFYTTSRNQNRQSLKIYQVTQTIFHSSSEQDMWGSPNMEWSCSTTSSNQKPTVPKMTLLFSGSPVALVALPYPVSPMKLVLSPLLFPFAKFYFIYPHIQCGATTST